MNEKLLYSTKEFKINFNRLIDEIQEFLNS